jgi:hypothetical protein
VQVVHARKVIGRPARGAAATCVAAASLLVLAVTGSVAAAPGLIVGATEDGFVWRASDAAAAARELGLGAARITMPWAPGEQQLDDSGVSRLDTATAAAAGLRLVVTVFGKASAAPQDSDERDAYCSYVRDILARYPTIRDVVIWNEANLGFYWQPQFNADGTSAAPAAYEALLARCWDVLHAFRPDVNVILTTSPAGNDNPNAASNVSHSPAAFLAKIAAAYRASGRTLPIFDTVGHNPYGMSSAESPSQQHLAPSHIGEGDYDRLVQTLADGFRGTAQPVPGHCLDAGQECVSVWYLEAGYQTVPSAAHESGYSGRENDAHPVGDSTAPTGDPTQASQLAAGVELAYCQPDVGAFFNFLLWDETDLARWQSGVFWSDGTPKASFDVLRSTIADMAAGRVDCSAVGGSQRRTSALVERIQWPTLDTFSVFNTIWTVAVVARAEARYAARLEPIGPGRMRPLSIAGTLARERPRVLSFPQRRLPAGKYRFTVVVTRTRPPLLRSMRRSPVFVVR